MKHISVITINYNNSTGLKQTIDSVICQKNIALEYIIIDGGSKDESVEVIKGFEKYLDYWVSESDNGVYGAQNKGIEKSTADYVLFLNSGDYFKNDTVLETLLSSSNGEDIVYGDIEFKNGDRHITESYPDELSFQFFLTKSLPHPCSLIKRSLFLQYGKYKENLVICADWAFFLDVICKHNVSYKHIPAIVSVFLTGGLSSNIPRLQVEKDAYLQEHYFYFWNNQQKLQVLENKFMQLKRSRLLQVIFSMLPKMYRTIVEAEK